MDRSRRVMQVGSVALWLLGAGAFWDGLYAPGQQLAATLLVAIAALLLPVKAVFSPLEWGAVGLLSAGVAGSLWAPAAAETAAHGPAIALGWVLAALLGRTAVMTGFAQAAERLLARFWAVTGALITFAGIAAIPFMEVHHSGRLASFLGYPIAVGILGLLGLAASLPSLGRSTGQGAVESQPLGRCAAEGVCSFDRRPGLEPAEELPLGRCAAEGVCSFDRPPGLGRAWAAPLALLNALAVVLSGSRGVWAAGVLLALYIAWAAPGLLRPAGRPLGLALAAALWIAPAVAQRQGGVALAVLGIALLTQQLMERFPHGRGPVAAGWALSLLWAPGWAWLWGRAGALPLTEGSSVERLVFLRDGWSLVRTLPWGGGYRAWSALHLQAASYPYFSAEVHSAPLDLTLAFGWLGGAGFLILLLRLFLALRRGRSWAPHRLVVMAGLAALAFHAVLDWELSYALFALPLWFGFGLTGLTRPGLRLPRWAGAAVAGIALALSLVIGTGDWLVFQARQSLGAGDPQSALLHAGAAVAVSPWNSLGYAYLAQSQSALGQPEAALAALARARALGPREPWYAAVQGRELAALGRATEAAEAYRSYAALWPWHLPAYEEALTAQAGLIQQALLREDWQTAFAIADSAQSVLGALEAQVARQPTQAPRQRLTLDSPAVDQMRTLLQQVRRIKSSNARSSASGDTPANTAFRMAAR